MDTLLVHPREVFKAAIVQGASAILFMHNHPSGDTGPSESDVTITRELVRAGVILKIPLLDHIIIGDKTNLYPGWLSLRDAGFIYDETAKPS